ncbi:hypothetical protein IAE23_24950 [Bacillus sp. S35]|uniref:DUF6602 domain-containing protein n=1 Tax=Priestia aryabhattai TaxID=412384 RepID=UPI00190C3F3F|nr:DUF6602 domain-containing protein [Priestia aryabhattai]MBK0009724.1 hypothetical protein [Bacillus sp. S35]MCM3644466.1 hypothetical protein [Priestia aryabhattai]
MPNKYFSEILNTNIEIFKDNFCNRSKTLFKTENSSSYIHNGEFGMYREALVREFTSFFTPGKFAISEGFVINHKENQSGRSTQCDVIIYDKSATPLVQDPALQTFYPIETVAAVGEVKSTLTEATLIKALNRLANTKRMRNPLNDPSLIYRVDGLRLSTANAIQEIEDLTLVFISKIGPFITNAKLRGELKLSSENHGDLLINNIKKHISDVKIQGELIHIVEKYSYNLRKIKDYNFNPNAHHEDNIVTFLICEKINFNTSTTNKAKAVIERYSKNLKSEFRHNMILSLEDGLFLYEELDESGRRKYSQYPKKVNISFKHVFIPADSKNKHIKIFANYLFMALNDVTILYPEITHYMEHTAWDPDTQVE